MLGRVSVAVAVFLVLLAACSSGRGQRSQQTVPAGGNLFVAFENAEAERATVFLESFPEGSVSLGDPPGPRRLGRVSGGSSQVFRLPAPVHPFQVSAAFDDGEELVTERLTAQPGDTVQVMLRDAALTFTVRAFGPSTGSGPAADPAGGGA